jgi:hypothetical protein
MMQTRLGQLGKQFPRVNNVIGKIQAHKQRDSIVLGIVIGICLIFTVFWMGR